MIIDIALNVANAENAFRTSTFDFCICNGSVEKCRCLGVKVLLKIYMRQCFSLRS